MATEAKLRNAAQEMITVMKLRDDDKQPIVLTEKMTKDDYAEVIKSAIGMIEDGDTFSVSTKKVINEFDITYFPEVMKVREDNDEEHPLPTLEQEIGKAEKIKELKEIALSEPEFKPIRGRIASFRTADELREEMLWILSDNKTPMKEQPLPFETSQQVAERLSQKLMNESVNAKVKHPPVEKVVETVVEEELDLKETMKVKDIMVIKPFDSLFDVIPSVLEAVTKSMKETGYDMAFPIVVWEDVCIDGHTRLLAAEKAGIEEVPVQHKSFNNEDEALQYSIHNQRDRRNITDAEILRLVKLFDKPLSKKEAGKKGGEVIIPDNKEKIEPTHKKTAKTLKIGETKVTDARVVLTDKSAVKDVESGKKSISKAAKDVRDKKKAEKPVKVAPVVKTRIQTAVDLIKNSQVYEIKIESLVGDTEREFISAGGKINYDRSKAAVLSVVEVLVAYGILRQIDNDVIEIVE
jgi:ParB family transcriptional regulator, chromosome partitioning protein